MARGLIAAAALLLATFTPARANDTQANVAYGGLIFEQNPDITMDSEDLFLSLEKVRVRYTYTNRSAKPVTILVAFPLPDVPLPDADWDWAEASTPDWDGIGMETKVNGKPVGLMQIDVPRVNGKDISDWLNARQWPVRFWEDKGLLAKIKALDPADRRDLIAAGLLTDEDMSPGEARPA